MRPKRFAFPLALPGAVLLLTAAQAPQQSTFRVGEKLPILRGSDLAGQPTSVDFSRPTALHFVTPVGAYITVSRRPFASLVEQFRLLRRG